MSIVRQSDTEPAGRVVNFRKDANNDAVGKRSHEYDRQPKLVNPSLKFSLGWALPCGQPKYQDFLQHGNSFALDIWTTGMVLSQ
jgi:hypothetical protein